LIVTTSNLTYSMRVASLSRCCVFIIPFILWPVDSPGGGVCQVVLPDMGAWFLVGGRVRIVLGIASRGIGTTSD